MIERLEILDVGLDGLKMIQCRPIGDSRGYLERVFCANELASILEHKTIVQINHTLTARRGTVRGMHLQQPPHAEIKLVSCLRGEVFDVAVDLRHGSPTLLRWHGEVLTADNHKTLVIPEGFAHGFQALTDGCEMLYLHTAAYQPAAERSFNPCDPVLNIRWPLPLQELSQRDSSAPRLAKDFSGVVL